MNDMANGKCDLKENVKGSVGGKSQKEREGRRRGGGGKREGRGRKGHLKIDVGKANERVKERLITTITITQPS